MMTERIKPDEPSRAPAMISSLLFRTKPMAAGGESGVCVQKRDDCGHVRAADGDDQQDSKD